MSMWDWLSGGNPPKTETKKGDNRTWDDLNTDLSLNEDATEEWGPDYPEQSGK